MLEISELERIEIKLDHIIREQETIRKVLIEIMAVVSKL